MAELCKQNKNNKNTALLYFSEAISQPVYRDFEKQNAYFYFYFLKEIFKKQVVRFLKFYLDINNKQQ